jgi:hypothetical protein
MDQSASGKSSNVCRQQTHMVGVRSATALPGNIVALYSGVFHDESHGIVRPAETST